jgi:CheY-like chemotaxis protein
MQFADGPSSLRVLIVDDLHDSADSLAQLIRFWGHEPVVAYEASAALQEASATPPDVVLLDIGLPKMDGWELARRLRQLPGMAKALLVALTGYGQEADVQRCKEAGIDCHFLKPVDPDELKQLLDKAEKLGHQQRQLAC